jgi:hypothetical protein
MTASLSYRILRNKLVVKWPAQAAYIEIDFHTTLLFDRSLPESINDSVIRR